MGSEISPSRMLSKVSRNSGGIALPRTQPTSPAFSALAAADTWRASEFEAGAFTQGLHQTGGVLRDHLRLRRVVHRQHDLR